MTHLLEDRNRRDLSFQSSRVQDLLPEYAQGDYPNLVAFLEAYYDYMSGTQSHSFDTEIHNIFSLRDTSQTELKYLDLLLSEIGNGLTVSSFFQQPRLMSKLLSSFYRSKGSLLSIEGFFRGFFNEEVSIEYPKDQIFIVGESEIGYESLRFIINDELYQTFSILIKVGLPVSEYETLYKKFVHPAGFFFQGQVVTEGVASLAILAVGENPLEVDESITLVGEALATPSAPFDPLSGVVTIST